MCPPSAWNQTSVTVLPATITCMPCADVPLSDEVFWIPPEQAVAALGARSGAVPVPRDGT